MKPAKTIKYVLLMLIFFMTGCAITTTSTKLAGSWSDPENKRPVEKIYIIGMSQDENLRQLFEEQFGETLTAYGVDSVSSYKDLKTAPYAHLKRVLTKVRRNDADAFLMTSIIGQRTEEIVNPGRYTDYRSYPYSRGYYPSSYYFSAYDYYTYRYDRIYESARVSSFEIVTLESNLYDAESGQLIWSAQMETVMGGSLKSRLRDFIKLSTKELVNHGII